MKKSDRHLEPIVCGNRVLDFNSNTRIMGVLNCTPDSFYPASRKPFLQAAISQAMDMIKAGVDIIDIGGESSRPGSDPVLYKQETERVLPVIKAIRKESDIIISIDTTKSIVAGEALDAGANIVNDISALKADKDMSRLLAEKRVPVILMHMRGRPKTMQDNPYYTDTMNDIIKEIEESVIYATKAGIQRNRIILDPGIGFGKRVEDNLRIIKNLALLKRYDLPLLIGLSRKSFLGFILDKPVNERLIGTITANTIAIMHGADIVRVHDYHEAIDMVKVINVIRSGK